MDYNRFNELYRNSSLLYGIKPRHILLCLVLFAVLVSTIIWAAQLEKARLQQALRSLVMQNAISYHSILETELNSNVFLVNGLVAFISARPDFSEEEINTALKTLYKYGQHLRNIGIAPGNRLSHVYPKEGNEGAIGLYYPDNPQQWPAVESAIASGSTMLAGPVNLMQGGSGLISRTPVFLEDGSFWGILSLVLDTDSLLKKVGLDSDQLLNIALRGRDGMGSTGEVFYGDPSIFSADPVITEIMVPGGTWQLAIIPAEGWTIANGWIDVAEGIGILTAIGLMFGILIILSKQFRITSAEKAVRTILDTTQDALLVTDQEGLIFSSNPAADKLFSYSRSELTGHSINTLIDDLITQKPEFSQAKPGKTRWDINIKPEFTAHSQDGRVFPAEISFGKNIINNSTFYVFSVKDISERKSIEQQLRSLASTDPLTGVYNRRAGLEMGEQYLLSAQRYLRKLTVMMIDADHFKTVNDTWGHDTGDRVLIQLVKILQQQLRESDIICRYGGEEFLIILPEAKCSEAQHVAQRILESIRATRVYTDSGEEVTFSVSIGLSETHSKSKNLSSIINDADTALYYAKNNGRDRLCLFDTIIPDQQNIPARPSVAAGSRR